MSTGDNELWFIYSPLPEEWADLRIATFVRSFGERDVQLVIIHNETLDRMGPRVWADIVEREGWVKVRRIEMPTIDEVERALP